MGVFRVIFGTKMHTRTGYTTEREKAQANSLCYRTGNLGK